MSGARVLIACEFSGVVRRAFTARGFDTWSCDLLPAEDGSNHHIRGDVRDHLDEGWDLLIVAHPPCTRLCNSGVRWLSVPPPGRTREELWAELDDGAALFSTLWNATIDRIAVENPVMHRHAKERIVNYAEPAQSVQPWQFGHGETKRTCLWLKNLPLLTPTQIVEGREARVHRMSPGPDRGKERSRFFPGIAAAMADQWGRLLGRPIEAFEAAPSAADFSRAAEEAQAGHTPARGANSRRQPSTGVHAISAQASPARGTDDVPEGGGSDKLAANRRAA